MTHDIAQHNNKKSKLTQQNETRNSGAKYTKLHKKYYHTKTTILTLIQNNLSEQVPEKHTHNYFYPCIIQHLNLASSI